MTAARLIRKCPNCQKDVFDTPYATAAHALECGVPQLTIVPPVEPAQPPQEEKEMATENAAPEKDGPKNGHSKGGNTVGKWMSSPQLSAMLGYHSGFFSREGRNGNIRTKGTGKATVYSSADAKVAAENAQRVPCKRGQGRQALVNRKPEVEAKPKITVRSELRELAERAVTGPLNKRIRYVVMGVELGVHSKEEAFDLIAALVGG